MELSVSHLQVVGALENILIRIKIDVGNCHKPFEHCTFNELDLSGERIAQFTDAINEQFSLKLSKKDVIGIRTIKGMIEVIRELA